MSNMREWFIRLSLMLGGTSAALVLIIIFAPMIINQGRAKFANIDLGEVDFMIGNGDLFIAQPGSIRPPNNPYELLSRHYLAWDADGFRVPQYPSEAYSIIALGDSYTEAANAAFPWPDILARESRQAVRNLGYRGYGPQELALVMQEYGINHNPDIIVIGFFGGNDISNAGSFTERENDFLLPEIVRDAAIAFDASGEPWKSDNEFFQYPINVSLNGQLEPIAFFNSYTSWLTVFQEDLRASVEFAAIRQSWVEIRDAAAEDACIIISYFPSKSHIYLPFVVAENRDTLVDGQAQRLLDESDFRIKRNFDLPPSYENFLERRNNIAIVLAEIAAEEGLHFVDLTAAFDAAAASGELLYYRYDTHWNQAGHELAGTVIADYIKSNCPNS